MLVIVNALVFLARFFFRPAITTPKGNPDPVQGTPQAGGIITNADAIAQIAAIQLSAAPAFGNWSQTLIPAISASTYPGAAIVGGLIRRFSPGAAFTDCTDTATNIIASIPGAKVNQSWLTVIANLGSGLQTLAAGTGVTLAGTATIGSSQCRLFLGQVTGSAAVTMTNVFAFNLGTGGTNVSGL